jgi:hypothetical protein
VGWWLLPVLYAQQHALSAALVLTNVISRLNMKFLSCGGANHFSSPLTWQ